MRKRYALLGIASALLVVASVIFVVGGLQFYREYQREFPDWTSDTGPCGALITWSPPTVLYTGLYVNQPSLLTLRYRSPQPQSLRISVSIPQFTQQQSFQEEATPEFKSLTFKPPLLNESVLDALIGPGERAAELHLNIENSSNVVCDISANIDLKSRLWMLWNGTVSGTQTDQYLAGWVTPDAQAIQVLIGRTNQWIQSHPSKYPGLSGLVGYDDKASPHLVIEQVDAIFDTLQFEYHVTYAPDNIPYLQSGAQKIRLPSDILTSKAPYGMCVETTAIMASAVESLGMRPSFIIVPGHAFLGVALSTTAPSATEFWETELLNVCDDGIQANGYGDHEYYVTYQNKVVNVIDVQAERQQGIMPIE
jgi:hypothetical protein